MPGVGRWKASSRFLCKETSLVHVKYIQQNQYLVTNWYSQIITRDFQCSTDTIYLVFVSQAIVISPLPSQFLHQFLDVFRVLFDCIKSSLVGLYVLKSYCSRVYPQIKLFRKAVQDWCLIYRCNTSNKIWTYSPTRYRRCLSDFWFLRRKGENYHPLP